MTDMPDKADLLPCPFCGSRSIDPHGWASVANAGPACDECGATAENAAAWNRRAALAADQPHMGGEPAAWRSRQPDGEWAYLDGSEIAVSADVDGCIPLYLAPPASPDVAALIEAARPFEHVVRNARSEDDAEIVWVEIRKTATDEVMAELEKLGSKLASRNYSVVLSLDGLTVGHFRRLIDALSRIGQPGGRNE